MKPIDASGALPGPLDAANANAFARGLTLIDKWLMLVAGLALLAAALVLTEGVFLRYFLKASTDWQDETAVFLLVAATFLSAPYLQAMRGHVGIEALPEILPPHVNRIRAVIVDILSLAFCTFFAWKSWTLCHEAWVEGQRTASTFAPPLWIPYSCMSIGMSLLCLRLVAQLLAGSGRSVR